MSQKRIDTILQLIKEQGYVTVKYLCETLHYSTATINRDLNDLKRQNLIVRHYGGAELTTQTGVPLVMRYHKMRPVKRVIAKAAVELVQEGMTIFIDGSTTTHYIGDYIKQYKNITVISNNINLCSHLSEAGLRCICLGGMILESPYMTCSSDTIKQAASYTADLVFFSTGGISSDGAVYVGAYYDLLKTMIQNAQKKVLLIDHQKLDRICPRVLCHVSDLDVIISDIDFSDTVHKKADTTTFLRVATPKTQKP